ncbi:MAG: outer membrane lipoprotein-sorting protein [Sphaerochaetaceae bacterium]|jgi:outer membrane lipoprotein-sorting protein|nr:outer membrane lipoprotein-sorting protein [Sphaerochaetaceae bacterium]MDX9809475.1 outer membrane lipoprotein-sorting protein [Sphaerochaetaceae bacterium]
MYRRIVSLIIACLFVFSFLPLSAITAEQIVRAMDDAETFETSYMAGSIETTDRFGTKTSMFSAWSKGDSDTLIEFTSLAERGQKILRTKGNLYLYYPDAQQLIRLQGAALRQSILGSDLSYEDMTGEKQTLDNYDAKLEGTESIGNRDCYVLTLTAKTRNVAYPLMKLWVDQDSFIVWQAAYYTSTERLLKEMNIIKTMDVDGRTVPVETIISDKLKKDSSSRMIIDTIEINKDLDPSLFSLDSLTW